jgi:hypothetical protein
VHVSTTAGSHWPVRLTYSASALFSLASGGTNLVYGWSKGADPVSSFVWAAVSVGVSVVFALSWPAFILSLDRKQCARAVMVLVALVVTGVYSVSAALGSAMGGRMNAAAAETATIGARQRAQAAYDQARTSLDQLAPSRPLAEVEALLAVAKPTCRVTTLNGKRDVFCTPNASLVAERARAQRRLELQAQTDRANAALSEAPAHVANSDAVALASYLTGLGVETSADRVNKLLVLLAVLVIECGGGLALTVGMALAGNTGLVTPPRDAGVADGVTAPVSPGAESSAVTALQAVSQAVLPGDRPARDRVLQLVRDAKGLLRTSHRALGMVLGVSASRAGRIVGDLALAGAIRVRTSSTGTVISLIEPTEQRAAIH